MRSGRFSSWDFGSIDATALIRRRPRILVVASDFPPRRGGIQLLLYRLVTNWERCEPHIVTLDGPSAREFDLALPMSVHRVRGGPIGHAGAVSLLNAFAVAQAARIRPNVVLSGHISVSLAARAAKRLLGSPYVQYAYGMELVNRPALTRPALAAADRVIAISRYTRDLARAYGAKPELLELIPPGVDLPSETHARRSVRPTVVTIARLDERYKGHDVLIRALPLIRARVPDVELIVVGDGRLRTFYEGLAASFGIAQLARFVGSVDDRTRDELLGRAHVFVMASRIPANQGGEGFGIAYLEAGARGVPVVAGNAAGARDSVRDGETGLLVDPTDHVAVADAVCDLLTDSEKARRFGQAGATHASQFAWEGIARRVEDVLLQVAAGVR